VVIDAIGTEAEAASAWKDRIVPRCRVVGDKAAYTVLQAYLTVRVSRIRKLAAEKAAAAKKPAVAHA
jgi:hypothetical protein